MMELYQSHAQSSLFDGGLQHFYPAFGGAANKQIKGLIIQEEGRLKAVDATWWYACTREDDRLVVHSRPEEKLTTFNARNLHQSYWRKAINHRRAIVIVSAIGEGKKEEKKKFSYFVEGETPLLLGAVYQHFGDDLYSTAIITRDKHPRFDKYHEKAFPLFLPHDPDFLKLWLSDCPQSDVRIADLLEHPKIFNRLRVTHVKTFKDCVALDETEILEPDDLAA